MWSSKVCGKPNVEEHIITESTHASQVVCPSGYNLGRNAENLCITASDTIKTPRCSPNSVPAAAHAFPETVERGNSLFPGNAGISHGLAILEHHFAGRRNILAAFGDVRFDHDTHDQVGSVSGFELAGLSGGVARSRCCHISSYGKDLRCLPRRQFVVSVVLNYSRGCSQSVSCTRVESNQLRKRR